MLVGSELVSIIAIIGIFSLIASLIANFSQLVSTEKETEAKSQEDTIIPDNNTKTSKQAKLTKKISFAFILVTILTAIYLLK